MIANLMQKKILNTRARTQAAIFSEKIRESNGVSLEIPLIKIDCKQNTQVNFAKKYQWIFFTSANGVDCFFTQIPKELSLEQVNIAAVGHKTEQALKRHGMKADFIPTTYNAETMAKEFLQKYSEANDLLLVRGNLSRSILPNVFKKYGRQVTLAEVYSTVTNDDSQVQLNEQLQTDYDMITFTSPSTVKAFVELVMDDRLLNEALTKPCTVIGTTTEISAKEYGFQTVLVPSQFTIEGMIEKMDMYFKQKGMG